MPSTEGTGTDRHDAGQDAGPNASQDAGPDAGHDGAVERLAALVDADPAAAVDAVGELLSRVADDPATRARLLVLRARARHFRRDLGAHDDTAAALELIDPEQEPLLAAQALNMHSITAAHRGDLHEQLRCLDRGLEALLRSDGAEAVRLRSVMRHNLAVALYDLGDARGALGLLADARREARRLGHPHQLEWVLMGSVAAASFLLRGYEGQVPVHGEEREALMAKVSRWTTEAVAAGGIAGDAPGALADGRAAAWCLARQAQLEGDLPRALVHARAALGVARSVGELDVLGRARILLAEVLVELDRLDEAEEILVDATGETARVGSVNSVMAWHLLATVRERRGDLPGAMAAMRRYVTAVTASRDVQAHSTAAVNAARLRREEVERERDSWRRSSENERRAARVDPLTGIENRRAFNDAMALHAAAGTRLAVAIIDLDHFKSVNDRFGHVAGDEVLLRVARAMSDTVRAEAPTVAGAGLYRVGGEEFVLTFPVEGLPAGTVLTLVDRVRRAVSEVDFSDIGLPVREDTPAELSVTASAGVALGVPVEAASPAGDLLSAADRSLYAAKHAGRDRLVGP